MQPYRTLKKSRSRLPIIVKVLEIQMQPYHTLKGSKSLLPSLFEVCGNPDATLSHFEGVEVTLA